MGVPILGRITGEGRLEGGDVCWLDERTVAVGEGYRTNAEGIRQLRGLLGDAVDEVIVVPLPHWTGPDDCLHLLSFISPVDHDLAVVYSRMMPVPFRQLLLERGIRLVEVPDEEYDSMACNVLAVAPRQCIMLAGNPITQQRLEAAGATVWTYEGKDLCLKVGRADLFDPADLAGTTLICLSSYKTVAPRVALALLFYTSWLADHKR